jgi:hypothetical protein
MIPDEVMPVSIVQDGIGSKVFPALGPFALEQSKVCGPATLAVGIA